jgi:hypothetical protein
VERFPRVVLLAGGLIMLAGGVVGIVLGFSAAAWLFSLLPPVLIDQAAVGGAAVALGVMLAAAGLAQLILAAGLRTRQPWIAATSATVSGLLGVLSFAVAVVLAVETARGGPGILLLAVVGVLVAAVAYGLSAWRLAGASS